MSNRDFAKTQIDVLPDSAVDKVIEFISFQIYSLGLTGNVVNVQDVVNTWAEFDRIVAESSDEDELLNDEAFARNSGGRELISFSEV